MPVLVPDQFANQSRLSPISVSVSGNSKIIPWTDDPNDINFENRGLAQPEKGSSEDLDALPFWKPPWWQDVGEDEFDAWKNRHEPAITDPILEQGSEYIHAKYGRDVKIGGVGCCFGGRCVMRLMGAGVIDVGVVNYPSFFTMAEAEKLGKRKKLALFATEKDEVLPREKKRVIEDLLWRRGAGWMSTVFGQTEHGFTVVFEGI